MYKQVFWVSMKFLFGPSWPFFLRKSWTRRYKRTPKTIKEKEWHLPEVSPLDSSLHQQPPVPFVLCSFWMQDTKLNYWRKAWVAPNPMDDHHLLHPLALLPNSNMLYKTPCFGLVCLFLAFNLSCSLVSTKLHDIFILWTGILKIYTHVLVLSYYSYPSYVHGKRWAKDSATWVETSLPIRPPLLMFLSNALPKFENYLGKSSII